MESQAPHQHELDLKTFILNIRAWWQMLLSKKLLIAGFGFIAAIIGLAISLLLREPDYLASTTFVLESNGKSKMDGYAGIAARFGLSIGAGGGGLFVDEDNMMNFLTSRTMIAQTLRSKVRISGKDELLVNRFLTVSGLRDQWSGNQRLLSIRFHDIDSASSILEDSVISLCHKMIVQSHLYVGKPDKDLGIIQITTRSKDELFSKSFTEKLLDNVTLFYVAYQTKKYTENVSILRKQVDSLRTLLNNALSGVATSTDANPNLNPAFQRVRVASQKRMVDVEMNKAILEELVKNLEISEIALRKETPLVQIIDRPVLPLEKVRPSRLKSTLIGGIVGTLLVIGWLSIRHTIRKILEN